MNSLFQPGSRNTHIWGNRLQGIWEFSAVSQREQLPHVTGYYVMASRDQFGQVQASYGGEAEDILVRHNGREHESTNAALALGVCEYHCIVANHDKTQRLSL
jgi:hypothetical protein